MIDAILIHCLFCNRYGHLEAALSDVESEFLSVRVLRLLRTYVRLLT